MSTSGPPPRVGSGATHTRRLAGAARAGRAGGSVRVYTHLQLAVLPIVSSAPEVVLLSLGVADLSDDLEVSRREWRRSPCPSTRSCGGDRLLNLSLSGNIGGVLVIDDLRLLSAASPLRTTAVVEAREEALPDAFTLSQNYPNPFNAETIIGFDLPSSQQVELVVYNLATQRVATLVRGFREAGSFFFILIALPWTDNHGTCRVGLADSAPESGSPGPVLDTPLSDGTPFSIEDDDPAAGSVERTDQPMEADVEGQQDFARRTNARGRWIDTNPAASLPSGRVVFRRCKPVDRWERP